MEASIMLALDSIAKVTLVLLSLLACSDCYSQQAHICPPLPCCPIMPVPDITWHCSLVVLPSPEPLPISNSAPLEIEPTKAELKRIPLVGNNENNLRCADLGADGRLCLQYMSNNDSGAYIELFRDGKSAWTASMKPLGVFHSEYYHSMLVKRDESSREIEITSLGLFGTVVEIRNIDSGILISRKKDIKKGVFTEKTWQEMMDAG